MADHPNNRKRKGDSKENPDKGKKSKNDSYVTQEDLQPIKDQLTSLQQQISNLQPQQTSRSQEQNPVSNSEQNLQSRIDAMSGPNHEEPSTNVAQSTSKQSSEKQIKPIILPVKSPPSAAPKKPLIAAKRITRQESRFQQTPAITREVHENAITEVQNQLNASQNELNNTRIQLRIAQAQMAAMQRNVQNQGMALPNNNTLLADQIQHMMSNRNQEQDDIQNVEGIQRIRIENVNLAREIGELLGDMNVAQRQAVTTILQDRNIIMHPIEQDQDVFALIRPQEDVDNENEDVDNENIEENEEFQRELARLNLSMQHNDNPIPPELRDNQPGPSSSGPAI